MNIAVNLVKAYVRENKGGNLAGIVFDERGLTQNQKQKIARQAGLSETAFISAGKTTDYYLEFFTPTRQIANCGHATVAAFGFMQEKQMLPQGHYSMQTQTGTNQVTVQDGLITMQQRKPIFQEVAEEKVYQSLGLTSGKIASKPFLINTGNSFLVLEVLSAKALAGLTPDAALITEISEAYDLVGFYIFTRDVKGADASARMFAPRYGIPEESATGMAAGPLGCYLYAYGNKKEAYTIQQGDFMAVPSPSSLIVKIFAKNEEIEYITVSGQTLIQSVLSVDI